VENYSSVKGEVGGGGSGPGPGIELNLTQVHFFVLRSYIGRATVPLVWTPLERRYNCVQKLIWGVRRLLDEQNRGKEDNFYNYGKCGKLI